MMFLGLRKLGHICCGHKMFLNQIRNILRWRNTRYKNPQLVAQHCFVASFRRCFPFFTLRDQLDRNKNICCGLKKVVAKSRARVYFEQQILALLLVFHQNHNLSRNKFARALANQPISAPYLFNPQQTFLLRIKFITQGEKRETSTKTCNETMLRDKLRVFVSRISPPLFAPDTKFVSATNLARADKRGNICVGHNVSATMCPPLPGPLYGWE